MNNAELIDYVATHSSVLKKDAKVAIEMAVTAIKENLKKGGSVTVAGLGQFGVGRLQARVRRNPQTQALINVASKIKPKFEACKALKEHLN